MKKTLFVLAVVALGCKERKPGKRIYTVVIERTAFEIGSRLNTQETIDTFVESSDTVAYEKAVISYYSRLMASDMIENKSSRITGFKLLDATNHLVLLDERVKDSIENQVEQFMPNVRSQLGLTFPINKGK